MIEPTLWIGHPFAFDAAVSGAEAGDAFTINVARVSTNAPIELAWTGPADPDGWLRVRFSGADTQQLQQATYRGELTLRRRAMSGILGTLLTFGARRALTPPLEEAPLPLVNGVGKLLRISIEDQSPVPVQLVAGLKGENGAAGDAFDFVQPSPSAQWTIAHHLGRRPSVTVLSVGGVPMEGAIVHLSNDVLRIDFLIPVAGSAHLV